MTGWGLPGRQGDPFKCSVRDRRQRLAIYQALWDHPLPWETPATKVPASDVDLPHLIMTSLSPEVITES